VVVVDIAVVLVVVTGQLEGISTIEDEDDDGDEEGTVVVLSEY
jgi:hypothetical protein